MKKFIYSCGKEKLEISLDGPFVHTDSDLNSFSLAENTEKYPDTDGDEPIETLYEARPISISGYIRAESKYELRELRHKLERTFNGKDYGKLMYCCDNNKFYADVKADRPVGFGNVIGNMQTFIIYLKIHDFYWKKYRNRFKGMEHIISTDRDLIRGEFQLPCVWTEIYTRKTVYNAGDVKTPPVISVMGTEGERPSGDYTESGIDIINHSTGEHLLVKCDTFKGETLVIDNTVPMIFLNGNDGLQYFDESDGSDFFDLQTGGNDIEIVNKCKDNTINVSLEFTEKYRSVPI